MTLDDILASLFPDGHDVRKDQGILLGSGQLRSGGRALVVGVADRTPLGVDEAIRLSRSVLDSIEQGSGPILVIVDSDSQRMAKRDELLGLNEFLAHLAKCLIYADLHGRPTIGLLYGHSLENLARTGAVLATWGPALPLAAQLEALLDRTRDDTGDKRDALGKARKGRLKAADIAERVHDLALQSS